MKLKILAISLAISAVLLIASPPRNAVSDIYKWVDDNGVIHFSDQSPGENEAGANVDVMPSTPMSVKPPAAGRADKAAQTIREKPPAPKAEKPVAPRTVELYVTSWCRYCKQAKAWLKARGIPFKAYDVEKDSRAARRRRELHPSTGVPLAVINDTIILGFSETSYQQALQKGQRD